MMCEDCGSPVQFNKAEYIERKERLGIVLCYRCRRGSPSSIDGSLNPSPSLY